MPDSIAELETDAESQQDELGTALAPPGYAPYAQLIKMLLPRSTGVAIYDRAGSLSWSSTGYDKPEFREIVDRYATIEHSGPTTGTIRMTSAGYPAFFAAIRSGRRFLGSLVVDLGQTRDVWNETVIAGLLTPVLRCLENCLELERSIDFRATREDDALDLLLEADEDNPEGPSPLHRLLQHTIKHLDCSIGALVITDKNLVVACNADGETTKASKELLNRTQKNLLAWAQLNNRPMLVNRVGPNPDSTTFKILSCPIRNPDERVNGVLALFRDTEQADFDLKDIRILEFIARRAIAVLHSRHDPLTGLANRLIFERRVQRQLNTRGQARSHAVLYVDIDQLQSINETFGYHAGDEVIQRLGEAVQQELRPVDDASRLGGDRIAVYLHECNNDAAKTVAENIIFRISQLSYVNGDTVMPVSISIGLVTAESVTYPLSHLLAAAERACKDAKVQGRNRVVSANAEAGNRRNPQVRADFSANLEHALANNEFRLEAQAIKGITISRGEIMGHEVLLRVRNAGGELVAPDKFLDAAERYELTAAIDRWVISNTVHAFGEAAVARPDPANQITLNVSEQSLKTAGFAEFVLDELSRAGLRTQAFRFDIREAAALNNLKHAEAFVRTMRDAGAQVGLDDFGVGLSSFANLKTLPVQYLKIDGSLIRRVLTDHYAESVIKGIVKAAEILGVFTVAEHVESAEIAERLEELEVHFGQGYHLGRPRAFSAAFASDAPELIT